MTRSQRRVLARIVIVAVLVLVAYWGAARLWPKSKPPLPEPSAKVVRPAAPAPEPGARSRPRPGDTPPGPTDRAKAMGLLRKGMDLLGRRELVAARSSLADALACGTLPRQQAADARKQLDKLAVETIFSPQAVPGDPCTSSYTFKPGDLLARIERSMKLRVPAQLILRINGISDARKIQAGQTLKLVRGPFHAVITKRSFTADVYLEEPKTRRMIFVRRFPVGVGKDKSTPVGRWRVVLGGKMTGAPWTPPVSSGMPRRRIYPGQSGYALGRKGYWIGLEGIEGTSYTKADGYGMHDTHDQSSVGKAVSLGCIRLADGDIDLLFAMLYEKWSTVTIVE